MGRNYTKFGPKKNVILTLSFALIILLGGKIQRADAMLLTDPNDPRSWQGATVGTFATLYYGSDTLANRQLVIDNKLLDDGIFDPTGYIAASLLSGGGGCLGTSLDSTGTGSYAYACDGVSVSANANTIDNLWFQSNSTVGATVFDLGFDATKAAIFPAIDHGPIPQESIESTVYLSNDLSVWTEAQVERVWLEGFQPNLGILWDGFVYAVGTGTSDTFRYASIINGGPGALQHDGDDEINGLMGLKGDFTQPSTVPEPSTMFLLGSGILGALTRRRRS